MPDFLTVKQAADRLGVSIRTIERWRKHKGLPSYKMGHLVRINPRQLDAWLEKRLQITGGIRSKHERINMKGAECSGL